ncbi:YesL family protein [Lachnoclostridium sp. An118]|uniref:YesL family protein n=1 Tax=Lachnoclostridium sp. An118 TaxID=1965547 RepID=UPI000B38E73C|nr:YesL family protein [Lachnoclostridium sp. An118]OUQ47961.1 hypothetical protein B5E62_14875 [Lachnoclostridium sp. An118]
MNPDSRIMSFLAKLGDMFILNVLYLVCCIPVITIGAATTALYYNTLKMAENRESYVWREFLRTFKENFKQATIIWMIILVIGAVLVGDFLVMGGIGSQALASVTAIVVIVVGVFLILTAVYVFPVLARFDNSVLNIMKYALLMAIRHLPSTVVILAIHSVPMLLAFASLEAFIRGLLPVLLFTVSILAYFESKLFSRIFSNYYPKTEDYDFAHYNKKNRGGFLTWQNRQK